MAFFLGLISAGPLLGQAANSPVAFSSQDAITSTLVQANNTGTSSSSSAKNWLKVEIHYGTTAALTTPFLDELQIKIWVEGRDLLDPQANPDTGVAVGLTGDATYINIPANRDIYGVFYIHPDILSRYSGKSGPSDFQRNFNIHAELYVGGKIMDAIDKNKDPDPTWYQKVKAVTSLVYRQNQCPFLNDNPDRYPALKLPAAND